ncbi:MAG TPA: hypothetical protein VL689_21730 [Paraburkholderia sp.]|jgi:hypothetical protein|nr:hypothetical protein [Paraburkholderia sp.]
MQIGGQSQLPHDSTDFNIATAGTTRTPAEEAASPTRNGTATLAQSSSQDDAVRISPQGYAAALADANGGAANDESGDPAGEANVLPDISQIYGALGLDCLD